jgi:hypothetical protein
MLAPAQSLDMTDQGMLINPVLEILDFSSQPNSLRVICLAAVSSMSETTTMGSIPDDSPMGSEVTKNPRLHLQHVLREAIFPSWGFQDGFGLLLDLVYDTERPMSCVKDGRQDGWPRKQAVV